MPAKQTYEYDVSELFVCLFIYLQFTFDIYPKLSSNLNGLIEPIFPPSDHPLLNRNVKLPCYFIGTSF